MPQTVAVSESEHVRDWGDGAKIDDLDRCFCRAFRKGLSVDIKYLSILIRSFIIYN